MSTTERTCKHCGLHYDLLDRHATGSYCGMCNTPTLVVVVFNAQRDSETAEHIKVAQQVNAFFAEYGIGRDQVVFPPTTNTIPDTNELWGEYTIIFVLEVPAYVAGQIEARNG